ncbi:6-phosphogluconate dehydrogenase C-terminal domain-like protein [Ramaria rubella]|nr:6-phosphogluconate dehydrogenase C-terminal domain-like protein [Ramaria rubella]
MLQVCVVGFGALGTLYSFVLERSGRAQVTAVCRSNFDILNSRGVDIRSEKFGLFEAWRPSRVVRTTSEACDRQYDYVVASLRFLPDLVQPSKILSPLINHASTFVLIQNGIGLHDELKTMISPSATIISACAWIYASAVDGGQVVKHGLTERLVIGIHWPKSIDEANKSISQNRLDTFVDVLCGGGSAATITDHIDSERWRKNLWNIGYSVFSTLSRANLATVLSDKWIGTSAPVIYGLMEEDATHISNMNYAETYARRADNPTGFKAIPFKPSMLVDLEMGRPMEIEGIVGSVVRRGKEAGVMSPRLEAAYANLLLLQEPLLHAATRSST